MTLIQTSEITYPLTVAGHTRYTFRFTMPEVGALDAVRLKNALDTVMEDVLPYAEAFDEPTLGKLQDTLQEALLHLCERKGLLVEPSKEPSAPAN